MKNATLTLAIIGIVLGGLALLVAFGDPSATDAQASFLGGSYLLGTGIVTTIYVTKRK